MGLSIIKKPFDPTHVGVWWRVFDLDQRIQAIVFIERLTDQLLICKFPNLLTIAEDMLESNTTRKWDPTFKFKWADGANDDVVGPGNLRRQIYGLAKFNSAFK